MPEIGCKNSVSTSEHKSLERGSPKHAIWPHVHIDFFLLEVATWACVAKGGVNVTLVRPLKQDKRKMLVSLQSYSVSINSSTFATQAHENAITSFFIEIIICESKK